MTFKGRKLVIFDFDGVICNSLALTIEAMNRLAPWYRFRQVEDVEYFRSIGVKEGMKQLEVSLWKVPLLVWHMRKILRRRQLEMSPFEGISEVFQDLVSRSFEIRIFTSNSLALVSEFTQRHSIPVHKVHAGVGLFSKPGQLKRLKKHLTQNFLYFGDEGRDMEACRFAGVTSVAVTWGFANEKQLLQMGPNHLIRRPREILGMAESFYKN